MLKPDTVFYGTWLGHSWCLHQLQCSPMALSPEMPAACAVHQNPCRSHQGHPAAFKASPTAATPRVACEMVQPVGAV